MKGEQEVDAEDGLEVDMTNAIDALWKSFKSLVVAGKRSLKSRMCEIAYPTTTRTCPPSKKIKTKGGVKTIGKKSIRHDIYHDRSYHDRICWTVTTLATPYACSVAIC